MGYRMQIDTPTKKEVYYGSKLFGYCDKEKLKSFSYLKELGEFDDDMVFYEFYEFDTELTPDEFRKFIELYNEDMNTMYAIKPMYRYGKDDFINQIEIQYLLKNNENKKLSWG